MNWNNLINTLNDDSYYLEDVLNDLNDVLNKETFTDINEVLIDIPVTKYNLLEIVYTHQDLFIIDLKEIKGKSITHIVEIIKLK